MSAEFHDDDAPEVEDDTGRYVLSEGEMVPETEPATKRQLAELIRLNRAILDELKKQTTTMKKR